MGRLKTLPPRLKPAGQRLAWVPTPGGQRLTGRRLQARRLRIWTANPACKDCNVLTRYPDGFELDHDVALVNGGEDTDANCCVRCIECHAAKTLGDIAKAGRPVPRR